MRGECGDVVISVKQPVGKLGILIHIDDIENEYAPDLSGYHVALGDGLLFLELVKERFAVLGTMTFEFDGHDRCQMPLGAIRVNDRNDPLNRAYALQLRDTPKTRRWREADAIRQYVVGEIGILLEDCQNAAVDLIKSSDHAA